jgi:hypothetical protein
VSPLSEELLKRLDALATKMGTTVDHLWPVLLRQQRIEGIYDVVVGLLLVVVCVAIWRATGKYIREHEYDSDIAWPVRVVGIGIFGLFALVLFGEAITCLLNPEYAALKALAEMFKASK